MARMRRGGGRRGGRRAIGRAELRIEGLGGLGDGMAEQGGKPVAVPFAAPGDLADVEIEAGARGFRTGRLLSVLEAGPARAEPVCRHFTRCGGCRVQHVGGAAYAAWKDGLWRAALARAGIGEAVLRQAAIGPLRQVPPRSRRRARLALRGRSVGFRAERSHAVEPLSECHVLDPDLFAAATGLAAGLADAGIDVDELSLTVLEDGIEAILHGRGGPDHEALQAMADLADRLDLARLSHSQNGDTPMPVAHRRAGVVRFGGVPVVAPPFGFLQATALGEEVLREAVCGWLEPAGRIADLFCGSGTFALPLAMAREGRRLVAVDRDGPAIEALGAAAARPETGGRLTCQARDLQRDPLAGRELEGLDGAVFDPPRAGAKAQAEALAASNVPDVVAVSCNPATFARDASILLAGGYRLRALVPLDQFLWTAHLELAAHFSKS